MDKVILKTALKTVLAVIIAFILALIILCFGFPRTTADICRSFGNYSLAASFSSLNYKYYGEIDDLYACANYSILSKDDKKIISYCKQFAADEKFEEYCADKDGVKQWVLSNLSAAQYRRGDKEGALKTAEKSLADINGFPSGNAVIALTIEVGKAMDRQTATALKEFIDGADIIPSAEEQATFDNVTKILTTVINHQGE